MPRNFKKRGIISHTVIAELTVVSKTGKVSSRISRKKSQTVALFATSAVGDGKVDTIIGFMTFIRPLANK